jgi:hypothetical protein
MPLFTAKCDDSVRMVGDRDREAGPPSARWLYSDFVVDGTVNPLFAAKVALCRLN